MLPNVTGFIHLCGRRVVAPLVVSVGALILVACPLPIPHLALVTPTVAGTIHRDDGSPVAHAVVAATADDDDVSCRKARTRTTTDAHGRFQLPEIRVERKIAWVTMFETLGMKSYWLCATASGSDSTSIRRAMIHGHEVGDAVACLEWHRERDRRLTCASSRAQGFVSGGHWTDGGVRGWYRVIVADDEPWGYEGRVFVQWLDSSSTGARPVNVRAQVGLDTGPPVKTIPAPILTRLDDRWYVTLVSSKPTTWGNERELRFELGPPGEVKQMPER